MEVGDLSNQLNLRRLIGSYGLVLILLLLLLLFTALAPTFFSFPTLVNVSRQVATIGICAVGMTIVMISGGLDLSIGSVLGLVNIVGAKLIVEAGIHPVAAIGICLLLAAGIGVINAFWITVVDIPPLIATLGMMTSLRGVSYVLSGGRPIWGFSDGFRMIGRGYVAGIPIPVLVMLGVFLAGWAFLNFTRHGRFVYGIGGSETAARRSGISVIRTKFLVYILSSVLAALAGLLVLSRLNAGLPTTGTGLEMEVVTAVVLGGVSIYGGKGSVGGVFVGVFIMGVLSIGMTYLNVTEYVQLVIRGLVLLVAIGLGNLSRDRQAATAAA
jgi:ribose/xylose/arabinose/galactoside ABC-type transport system permease subunit